MTINHWFSGGFSSTKSPIPYPQNNDILNNMEVLKMTALYEMIDRLEDGENDNISPLAYVVLNCAR